MSCIGVVLAGGLSKRMGHDKALLPTKDGNLLQRTIRVLQTCCDDVWISGRKLDGFFGVMDQFSQRGPVGAIHAICQQLREQGDTASTLLIVPVDLPNLQPDALAPLMHSDAPVSFFSQHPLPAYIRSPLVVLDAAERLLQAPSSASVNALWRRVQAQELPLADGATEPLTNVNTPEQWALYCSNKRNGSTTI